MLIFLLDFVIFLLILVSAIFASLTSLPFFPKILSDTTLFSQFIFIFGIFLAFLLYCIRSLLKSYVLNLKSCLVPAFALFTTIIFLETIYTLHPAFLLTSKQFSLANIDSLIPGLSWLALLFLLIIFISNPLIHQIFKNRWSRVLLITFIIVITIINIIFSLSTLHLSLLNSWQISIGQIGSSPLLGTGPGLFLQAFDKFRPVELNNSPFWQVKFGSSGNEYLEILTTAGLLGFGAYVLFMFTILRTSFWLVQNRLRNDSGVASLPRMTRLSYVLLLISYVLLAFFIPLTLPLRIFFVVLIALTLSLRGENEMNDEAISFQNDEIAALRPLSGLARNDMERRFIRFLSITIITFIIIIIFILTNYFRAELSYKQSLDALTKNKPQEAYQKNLEAIQFFPYKDNYHLTLSQISLAWANALAQSANRRISSDQKTLVGQLLGQAINQAKLAVTLAPNKSSNLENLGIIYKNLIGVAADSDRWSLAAFNSAAQLDPVNPVLRLEIGGVYYIEKDYENAQKAFQNSLFLKPDYANGLYNLALTQHALGKTGQAKDSLKQVINLTTPGSIDFQNAQKQLSAWENEQTSP